MIGRVSGKGRSFKGIIRYMLTGEKGRARMEHRVEWLGFLNLPTRDPEVAACMMAATANASVSNTRAPVYHFSVSCAPDDPVNRDVLGRIAARTIRDMDLGEYEVAVFAHKDRPHPHLHFVVNRVHPERRTLWSPWRDRLRLEASLRAQEQEFGLRIVPGWLAPVSEPEHGRAPSRIRGPQREGAAPQLRPRPGPRRGDAAFLAEVRKRAAPVMERARSWAELQRGLAAEGLCLRVKGGGFRVGDERTDVKASDVGRQFSRRHLEQRFGPYLPDYSARMAVAHPAPTLTPPAPELAVGTSAHQEPPAPAPAASAPPAPRAADPAPEPEPTPPPAPLLPDEGLRVLLEEADHQRLQGAGLHMQLRHVAELFRVNREARLRVREHAGTVLARNEAGTEVERLKGLDAKAKDGARVLVEVLGRVYTDRREATRELIEYARRCGMDLTQSAFASSPERFGTLRRAGGVQRLRVAWAEATSRKAARDGAERVATAVGHWLARPPESELDAARQRFDEAREAELSARAAKEANTGVYASERKIIEALRAMLAQAPHGWVRQQLARIVPPDDHEAAGIANRAYLAAYEAVRGEKSRHSGYDIS